MNSLKDEFQAKLDDPSLTAQERDRLMTEYETSQTQLMRELELNALRQKEALRSRVAETRAQKQKDLFAKQDALVQAEFDEQCNANVQGSILQMQNDLMQEIADPQLTIEEKDRLMHLHEEQIKRLREELDAENQRQREALTDKLLKARAKREAEVDARLAEETETAQENLLALVLDSKQDGSLDGLTLELKKKMADPNLSDEEKERIMREYEQNRARMRRDLDLEALRQKESLRARLAEARSKRQKDLLEKDDVLKEAEQALRFENQASQIVLNSHSQLAAMLSDPSLAVEEKERLLREHHLQTERQRHELELEAAQQKATLHAKLAQARAEREAKLEESSMETTEQAKDTILKAKLQSQEHQAVADLELELQKKLASADLTAEEKARLMAEHEENVARVRRSIEMESLRQQEALRNRLAEARARRVRATAEKQAAAEEAAHDAILEAKTQSAVKASGMDFADQVLSNSNLSSEDKERLLKLHEEQMARLRQDLEVEAQRQRDALKEKLQLQVEKTAAEADMQNLVDAEKAQMVILTLALQNKQDELLAKAQAELQAKLAAPDLTEEDRQRLISEYEQTIARLRADFEVESLRQKEALRLKLAEARNTKERELLDKDLALNEASEKVAIEANLQDAISSAEVDLARRLADPNLTEDEKNRLMREHEETIKLLRADLDSEALRQKDAVKSRSAQARAKRELDLQRKIQQEANKAKEEISQAKLESKKAHVVEEMQHQLNEKLNDPSLLEDEKARILHEYEAQAVNVKRTMDLEALRQKEALKERLAKARANKKTAAKQSAATEQTAAATATAADGTGSAKATPRKQQEAAGAPANRLTGPVELDPATTEALARELARLLKQMGISALDSTNTANAVATAAATMGRDPDSATMQRTLQLLSLEEPVKEHESREVEQFEGHMGMGNVPVSDVPHEGKRRRALKAKYRDIWEDANMSAPPRQLGAGGTLLGKEGQPSALGNDQEVYDTVFRKLRNIDAMYTKLDKIESMLSRR